jgi:hypothetical protein
MGVQFKKAGVTTLNMPWPAGGAAVKPLLAQSVHRTSANSLYAVKHAPTRYQVTRKFESLSDSEMNAFVTFFEAIGGLANDFIYRYQPKGDSNYREVICSFVEPPEATRISRDIWDVTVVVEQSDHPNRYDETTV